MTAKKETKDQTPPRIPSDQRNTRNGSVWGDGFWQGEEATPHPGAILFDVADTQDLVIKSDIPEAMVPIIGRMLWKAERYKIDALERLVRWYLLTRLGRDREARKEYIQLLVGTKKKNDDEDDLLAQAG